MRSRPSCLLCVLSLAAMPSPAQEQTRPHIEPGHLEVPVPPPARPVDRTEQVTESTETVMRGTHASVQVNVDALGNNIVGDAANEPSLAVDPTNPDNIVIGWRQFDTVSSDFRQAGYAFSRDGGSTWTFPGSLDAGQFRSDPVLGANSAGDIFYYSLSTVTTAEMFISSDAGDTWTAPISAQGGDKTWMAIDATGSVGDGHIYLLWNSQFTCCASGTDFTRSTDGGLTYEGPFATPVKPKWGTLTVGPDGEVYVTGATLDQSSHVILRSTNARDALQTPTFDLSQTVNLGGVASNGLAPNPGGLLGQVWVDTDKSTGPTRGNVYILASVDPPGADPQDVHLIRSEDGGQTWTAPIRVNSDVGTAYQWNGTMSVAPDGRIDVTWNDTRNDPTGLNSELYYAYSTDAGDTWSAGLPVSPAFDSTVGYPQQNKMGDYYHSFSDADGMGLAYAATFNGEQDVFFIRVGDCNANGLHDSIDVANMTSADCNADGVPDECEADCNSNGVADGCDIDDSTSVDCDQNAIPDECDLAFGGAQDCNGDSQLDQCAIDLDLETDEGWTVGDSGDTATTGIWVRVDPNGTSAQPEDDHTPSGTNCFVTGQGPVGGGLGTEDVDGGATTLFSPSFDLSGLGDPHLAYWRWYSNDQGGAPNADVFTIDIASDGVNWINVETVGPAGPGTAGGWVYHTFRVADFVTPTADVQLRFIAADEGTGSIVEAAVDDVTVTDCAECLASVPGEVNGVQLTLDGTVATITWAIEPGASAYDVYRGAAQDATDLACFQNDVTSPSTTDDGQTAAPGAMLTYVVAAVSCAGESPLGSGRVAATPCP